MFYYSIKADTCARYENNLSHDKNIFEINTCVLCNFWNDLVYKDKMSKTDDDFGAICVACAQVFISPGEISFKTGTHSKSCWLSVRHEMALAVGMMSMNRKQK